MSFNTSKLSNSLNVVTFSMPHVKTVSINVTVKVGSRYESIEESGISHFLEHMAFKGTKHRSAKQIAKEFDSIGGYFNAYTSKEQTVYYTKVLNEHFPQALEILADILQNSLFSEEEIQKELNVILQEIAGVKDTPEDLAYEELYTLAYKDHPLGRSILGTPANLKKFTSASFQKYIDKHYTADNIYLSVAGNIEHENIINHAEKLFSKSPASSKRELISARYEGGYKLTKKTLEQTTLALGFESIAYNNIHEFYHAHILSLILGGGLSSRLFQTIREDLGLAYDVGSFNSSYIDSGIFSIYAAADHKNIQKLLDNLILEINKIKTSISEEELTRAKAQIKSSIYMAEEKSEYKSEEIGKNFALFGRNISIDEVLDIIMQINCLDIITISNKIFTSPPTLSIVGEEPINFNFSKLQQNLIK